MPNSGAASVSTRLNSLFELEHIDSTLDELYEAHGDLPREVAELHQRRDDLQSRITAAETRAHESVASRATFGAEIEDLLERERKYREQQLHIRTNREYDSLVREIDQVDKRVTELRAKLKPLDQAEQSARVEQATLLGEMEVLAEEIAVKELEYDEVRQTTNDEETRLLARRAAVLSSVNNGDLELYERIRKARGGRAVVAVKGNSCTGCFNFVPHQRIVELRKHEHIITCENCGRILVPESNAS